MLIVENAKTIALNLKNPNRVLDCIPTAKKVNLHGADLVLAPHRMDEVRVLRNLGILAPSPILHYYDWPGEFTPFEHQRKTAAFLTTNFKALVLNEIGTGKTQSALWAADYLMTIGDVKKCLVISPLSTLERVWGDAIFLNLLHRSSVTLHGQAKRRLKLLEQDHDFYIINHDGFKIISEQAQGMFDLVIIDEAAVYRNPSTNRFKFMRRWLEANPSTRLWMMTGTPTPNAPTDAWALAKLVDNPYVCATYTRFRDQTMYKVTPWQWAARPDATDIVQHVLQPAIRYTREECFDLPDTVYQTREVDLTKEQRDYYDTMMRSLVVQHTAGEIMSAANEAVKMQKLVQIACGVAYADDKTPIELDCSPRVSLLREIIDEVGGKVIVFVPLTGTLQMLSKEMSKHYSVAVVNGAVSTKKRNEIFHNFQHATEPRVLIAHPATMAHGLTLTRASTIVWYGPITSNEQYVQANGRIERIGKNRVANVIHIEATQLERQIFRRLKSKQKLQGLLLELVKQQTGEQANAEERNHRSSN